MLKRLLIFLILLSSLAFLAPKNVVFADSSTTNPITAISNLISSWKFPTAQDTNAAVYGNADINSESTVHFQNTNNAYDISDMIDKSVCISGAKTQNDFTGCLNQSTAMQLGGVIADMYTTKPADSGLFLADMGHSLGFIPDQAYAQGIGFSGLEPLLPIWKAFRNIAYLLMALVMIVLGFMIMFRKKIDPKTVVTAQNAIPRVIIALILITFSYAIVGFMIDIMYLLIFFIIAIFKSTNYLPDPGWWVQNVFHIHTNDALYGQGGIGAQLFNVDVNPLKFLGWNMSEGTALSGSIAAIIGGLALTTVSMPVGVGISIAGFALPLVHLVLAIVLLFLFLRLLAFFLSSYIQIIISLLLAPLQLLMEALPGSNSFSSWIKNLAANLAVFPIGGAMFMLSSIFANFSSNPGKLGSTNLWIPPYTSVASNTTAIGALISLGILFAIPSVAGSVKEALKAKPAMPMFDTGGGGAAVGQWLSYAYYIKMLNPANVWDKITGQKSEGGHGG